ncbi:peptidyl-prolyl cis-trans isomerase [Arenibacter sp. GZD96]|uniref:hypothetical protein n=1 Tax=Aurantibrevibacter litoralis TaxID=3106030 RepID=UPI002B002505|nr:hypothetical protein [Arenibacter sp. GZD-96]MEA1786233.1 peptidyl-prolyl cis-trans isomerase [Arenibacter sp. GZD-96]
MFSFFKGRILFGVLVGIFIISLNSSCNNLWKNYEDKDIVARVQDSYLYSDEIAAVVGSTMSKEDSVTVVTNYINDWAAKQLLFAKSKINLPETELAKYDRLVANYKRDLYTRAYKEALVQQSQDSLVSADELRAFYMKEKENFKLREQIIQLKYIQLPLQFLDKDKVAESLKRFNEKDAIYLDSIGVQFRKLNFNDSIWVSTSRVIAEIPPLTLENQDRYLKKSQFFELQDSLGVYLANITDVLKINDIAPLTYIEPTIRQVLMNRKRLDYLRKLETEIIDEAIKRKEFEVYVQPKE